MEEAEFAAAVERHRSELRVHCYRMVGSLDEAEDLVQEALLRAWKHRDGFAGRGTARAWLYGIATNACLDVLRGRGRRLPYQVAAASRAESGWPRRGAVDWLEPIPDEWLQIAGDVGDQPEEIVVRRETIELAFLAAIQSLPVRQRAVLILRDVAGWAAKDTAELLGLSVAAANSALQRARGALREQLPERRAEWRSATAPTAEERAVLRRYMTAIEGADLGGMAELLADEVRATMPPYELWFDGRDAVLESLRLSWDPALPGYVGRFRVVETRANRLPAAAGYVDGEAFAIVVMRIEGGRIVEMTAFHEPRLFARFGLPMSFPG